MQVIIELTCTDCQQSKPTSEFYVNKRYRTGYNIYCKVCQRRRSMQSHNKYRKTMEQTDPIFRSLRKPLQG